MPWLFVHRRQRLGQSRIGKAAQHTIIHQATGDNMTHYQDQEIVEQMVDGGLTPIIVAKSFDKQKIAGGPQRRVLGQRQDDKVGQSFANRVAIIAAQIDLRADQISPAFRSASEPMRLSAREEEQRWFVQNEIGLTRSAQRQRAALEKVEVAAIGKLRGRAQVAGKECPGARGGVGKESSKDVHVNDLQ